MDLHVASPCAMGSILRERNLKVRVPIDSYRVYQVPDEPGFKGEESDLTFLKSG